MKPTQARQRLPRAAPGGAGRRGGGCEHGWPSARGSAMAPIPVPPGAAGRWPTRPCGAWGWHGLSVRGRWAPRAPYAAGRSPARKPSRSGCNRRCARDRATGHRAGRGAPDAAAQPRPGPAGAAVIICNIAEMPRSTPRALLSLRAVPFGFAHGFWHATGKSSMKKLLAVLALGLFATGVFAQTPAPAAPQPAPIAAPMAAPIAGQAPAARASKAGKASKTAKKKTHKKMAKKKAAHKVG